MRCESGIYRDVLSRAIETREVPIISDQGDTGHLKRCGDLHRVRHAKSGLTPDARGSMGDFRRQVRNKPSWRRGQRLSIFIGKPFVSATQGSGQDFG